MAYRDTELGYLVRRKPREATRQIVEAYEREGFEIKAAAKVLEVTERTLSRWIVALGIDERLRKMRRDARSKAASP